VNEEQIEHMTTRFLTWKLPKDVCLATPPKYADGSVAPLFGRNLLYRQQAQDMIRYMIEDLPDPLSDLERAALDAAIKWRTAALKSFDSGNRENSLLSTRSVLDMVIDVLIEAKKPKDPVAELRRVYDAWGLAVSGSQAADKLWKKMDAALVELEAKRGKK